MGSSIATTISGAVKFQAVKIMFEAIMRLMPKIPFAKGFNEKIQGMALRFHLRKALSVSNDISDFRHTLQAVSENPSLNSQTRQIINKILGQVDEAQENIIKQIDEVENAENGLPRSDFVSARNDEVTPNPQSSLRRSETTEAIHKNVESTPNENDIIAEFGTNYAEFYHKPIEAFKKLQETQSGQVVGAYERKELGDIDLVWGNVWKDEKGEAQGFGLSKILAKHPEITPELLAEIIEKGIVENANGRHSIVLDNFRVGLKSNWKGTPTKNKWIITAYEVENPNKGGVKSIRTNSIASKDSPFETFETHSTTPAKINQPSPLELALKHKEQALKEAQDKIQAEQLAMQARLEELKAKQASMQAQKEALNGLSANE
ncbi:hypothetical protein CQA49_09395, partial [Helicobacter sp. MIT 00-7814]|uniref:putative barnase/colicin E5 family endoribonuclease n=1 Tax=unclassified Helicobacter TaxID=2593540 RepID=UPI000E36A37A